MNQDELFENSYLPTDFQFNKEVSECFDDMAQRSIPFYRQVIDMNAQLAMLYYQPKTTMYDLGFSTANLPLALSQYFGERAFSYIGLDTSQEMIKIAQKKIEHLPAQHHCRLLSEDITTHEYSLASVIFANYTFQFIRPMERLPMMRRLYSSLKNGGVFLMSEKVLENDGDISRQFIELYYRYKKANGYSALQISQKREALENVLIPYRLEENIKLMKQAGFDKVEVFFKWFNFASFVAVKSF